MRRLKNSCEICFLSFFVIGYTSVAAAGNTRAFFMGDEAAMTGGAGMAVTSDSGSVWYNPAGLGGLKEDRMELTATAYKLKLRKIENFVVTKLPSGTVRKDMHINSFGAVPTSVVFVRHLTQTLSGGLAVYQTGNMVESVRIEMNEPFSGGKWSVGLASHEESFAYHVGPALGWQIKPNFRLGASFFLIWETYTINLQEFLSITMTDSIGRSNYAYLWSEYLKWQALGIKLQAGFQWEIVKHFHLGFVLRSPRIDVYYRDTEVHYDLYIDNDFSQGADGGQKHSSGVVFFGGPDVETQVGLAYKTDKFWIGIEGAFRPPAESPNEGITPLSNEWLWNGSIGGRIRLTDTFNMGAGIFTDRSVKDNPTALMEEKTNRYGISLGAERRTPLTVKTDDKEKPLVWTSTLAVVYSFEIGKIGTLYYPEPGWESEVRIRDALFHQVFVHFGSALYF